MDFQSGDVLVRFGKVYKIFKVKKNKKQKSIYYKPLYVRTKRNNELICSIPLQNIKQTKIRRPLSKAKFEDFLISLNKLMKDETKVDLKDKEIFYSINLTKKSKVLRKLWKAKHNLDRKISATEKNFFNRLIESTKEELAYLFEIDPDQAEQKIYSELGE